jgi:hypothetical protein
MNIVVFQLIEFEGGLATLVPKFLYPFHQTVGLGKLMIDRRDSVCDDLGTIQ